jgi:hypothetical protein
MFQMEIVQGDKPCPECLSTDVRMIVLDGIPLTKCESGYCVEEVIVKEAVYLCWPCGYSWSISEDEVIQ